MQLCCVLEAICSFHFGTSFLRCYLIRSYDVLVQVGHCCTLSVFAIQCNIGNFSPLLIEHFEVLDGKQAKLFSSLSTTHLSLQQPVHFSLLLSQGVLKKMEK